MHSDHRHQLSQTHTCCHIQQDLVCAPAFLTLIQHRPILSHLTYIWYISGNNTKHSIVVSLSKWTAAGQTSIKAVILHNSLQTVICCSQKILKILIYTNSNSLLLKYQVWEQIQTTSAMSPLLIVAEMYRYHSMNTKVGGFFVWFFFFPFCKDWVHQSNKPKGRRRRDGEHLIYENKPQEALDLTLKTEDCKLTCLVSERKAEETEGR